MVNFWASWCVACRAEHDDLVATAAAFGDRGVRFLGVVYQDDPAFSIAFLDELGWGDNYEYVTDPGSRAAIALGVFGGVLEAFADVLEATEAAMSHEVWDMANAAFHEFQIDLAGNALLSRFYRELSVNLMMQVIRGGRVEGHPNLVTEHRRIVETFAAGDLDGAQRAIREHIETGRRIALDAIERAGGAL